MLGRLWIQIAAEEGAREGGRGREAGRGRETEREEGEVVIRRAGGLHLLPRLDVATAKFLRPEPPQNKTLFRHQRQVAVIPRVVRISLAS